MRLYLGGVKSIGSGILSICKRRKTEKEEESFTVSPKYKEKKAFSKDEEKKSIEMKELPSKLQKIHEKQNLST